MEVVKSQIELNKWNYSTLKIAIIDDCEISVSYVKIIDAKYDYNVLYFQDFPDKISEVKNINCFHYNVTLENGESYVCNIDDEMEKYKRNYEVIITICLPEQNCIEVRQIEDMVCYGKIMIEGRFLLFHDCSNIADNYECLIFSDMNYICDNNGEITIENSPNMNYMFVYNNCVYGLSDYSIMTYMFSGFNEVFSFELMILDCVHLDGILYLMTKDGIKFLKISKEDAKNLYFVEPYMALVDPTLEFIKFAITEYGKIVVLLAANGETYRIKSNLYVVKCEVSLDIFEFAPSKRTKRAI